MKETAYNKIVGAIRARHTWITVLQADRERNLMVQVGRELHEVRCRVLTLAGAAEIHCAAVVQAVGEEGREAKNDETLANEEETRYNE